MASPKNLAKKKAASLPAPKKATEHKDETDISSLPPALCRQCGVELPKKYKQAWCKVCFDILSHDLSDTSHDVLTQLSNLACLIEKYRYWTSVDRTPMAVKQITDLNERADIELAATYPVPLTSAAVQLKAYQENLTEAMKRWIRELSASDLVSVMGHVMHTFEPVSINMAVSIMEKRPVGHVVIKARNLRRVLGVETSAIDDDDDIVLHLADLFSLLDEKHSAALNFELRRT
jgi:hypothetical protein